MTSYVLAGSGQRLELAAFAPAHRFDVRGTGLTGRYRLEGDVLVEAEVRLDLRSLTANDRLKDHELRRFLEIPKNDAAEAKLERPCPLRRGTSGLEGTATFLLSLGARRTSVQVTLAGEPNSPHARFRLRFTQLGYEPPRLLLFSVKDEMELALHLRAEETPPASV